MKYCDSWVCYTPKATTLEYYVEKLKYNFPLRVKYQAEQQSHKFMINSEPSCA